MEYGRGTFTSGCERFRQRRALVENGMEKENGLILGLDYVVVIVEYLLFLCFCHFLLTFFFADCHGHVD